MARYGEARLPEGLRLYAIGDVHGELAQLEGHHEAIEADLEARPVEDWRVVNVGDLIDRGPESAGVLERLTGLDNERFLSVCGNHDAYLRLFLDDPEGAPFRQWMSNGGGAALASFGVDRAIVSKGDRRAIHSALESALPAPVRAYVEGLPDKLRFGDFGIVHAGVRPGVSWSRQTADDLHWIRQEFLTHGEPHDVFVVHGHTPVGRIELKSNRINIDTGAGKGGALSCVIIEGSEIAALGPTGPVALQIAR
ncbi:MAG: metallophosphoesterase [Pseudomonadota bacterium]